MINATEAREKSKKRVDEIVKTQLQVIEEQVLKACDNGDFFVTYKKPLKEETKKVLADFGYAFEEDGDEVFIRWEFVDEEKEEATEKDLDDAVAEKNEEEQADSCEDDNQEEETTNVVEDDDETENINKCDGEVQPIVETLFDEESDSEKEDGEAAEADQAVDEDDDETEYINH